MQMIKKKKEEEQQDPVCLIEVGHLYPLSRLCLVVLSKTDLLCVGWMVKDIVLGPQRLGFQYGLSEDHEED